MADVADVGRAGARDGFRDGGEEAESAAQGGARGNRIGGKERRARGRGGRECGQGGVGELGGDALGADEEDRAAGGGVVAQGGLGGGGEFRQVALRDEDGREDRVGAPVAGPGLGEVAGAGGGRVEGRAAVGGAAPEAALGLERFGGLGELVAEAFGGEGSRDVERRGVVPDPVAEVGGALGHDGLAAGAVDRDEPRRAAVPDVRQGELAERAAAGGDDEVGGRLGQAVGIGALRVAVADADALVRRGGVADLGADEERALAPLAAGREREVVDDEPAWRGRSEAGAEPGHQDCQKEEGAFHGEGGGAGG